MEDKEQLFKTTSIRVVISAEEIREALYKSLKHPHKELIADQIVYNLIPTDKGLSHLYKALYGMVEETEFYPLQKVYMPLSEVTWKADKDAMKLTDMVEKDHITATVIKIDLRQNYNVKVSYKYLDDSGETLSQEDWVKKENLSAAED